MNNLNAIMSYLQDVNDIVSEIDQNEIDKAIEILDEARKNSKNIFIIGNGGSASTATHLACDLNKYVSVNSEKRFRAFCLNDNIPLMSALVNDEGWDKVYSYQLENFMNSGDVLIAVSVHGGSGEDKAGIWSQNLLRGVKFVKENNGKVISLVGFDGGELKKISDASILVPKNSTPQVEGFHLIITHMICSILRNRLTND
jgi:D-sedoheptulose 7-phosphate isomerase